MTTLFVVGDTKAISLVNLSSSPPHHPSFLSFKCTPFAFLQPPLLLLPRLSSSSCLLCAACSRVCACLEIMGFSVEYSGLILAHLLYNAALVLSLFKWAFCWAVGSIGFPFWSSDRDSASSTASQQSALTAQMIRDRLGVTTYGEVISHSLPGSCEDDTCAVCLNQLKSRDKVRELRNCCHVFHIKCIDKWLDHGDQKNCPLCRAPLLVTRCGSGLGCDMTRSEPSWAVERLLYLFGDDLL